MLVYKRDVLQYMLALRNHENSLYRAREELATLINVSPEELKLAPAGKVRPEKITTDVAALQDHALVYRAELREEAYKERIDAYEVRRETLRLFPGLTAISSINYDSNKYLYYSTWKEMGLQASWNLIDLLKGRKSLAAAKAQVDYTRERRLALSSAILAQAAISYYQYEEARNTFATTDALRDVEQGLLKVARDNEKAESGSVLESLRQNVASISAQIDADRAYADTQTALASLLVSIGYDLVPPDAAMDDPDVLVRDMAPVLGALEKGKLPDVAPKGRLLKLDAASSAPAPAAPVVPAAAPVKVGTPVKKAAAEKPAAAVAAKAPAAPAKPVPSAPPVRKAEVNKAATMEKTAKTAAKQPPAAAKVAPNRATASAAAVNPEGRLPPELFAMPGQAGNASQKGRDCVIANDGSDKNSWSNRLRRRFFGEKMECAN